MSGNSGPGYQKNPDHRITLTREGKRVKVSVGGETIVDTGDAITLHEGNYPAVFYVPRKDVKMDRLVRTEHSTYCPYKGDASYFSLSVGGDTIENAVWSYEKPYDEVIEIKEHLAFYPKKVEISAA